MCSHHELFVKYKLVGGQKRNPSGAATKGAHQNANGGIMIGVVNVVRDLFDDLKQHLDKVVADMGFKDTKSQQWSR